MFGTNSFLSFYYTYISSLTPGASFQYGFFYISGAILRSMGNITPVESAAREVGTNREPYTHVGEK